MYGKTSVVYANVWEDPELNKRALKVQPTDVVLSITSGGCNSLNLLLENPKRVISIDCNSAQTALLDLKVAAFRELHYPELMELMGVEFFGKPSEVDPENRLVLYGRVRKHLKPESAKFWDEHHKELKMGLLHCGAVERFFKLYRKVVQTLYKFDGAEKLFFCESVEEQRQRYAKVFKNRVRLLNHLILNKFVLSAVKGRHSFKYVNDLNFGRNFNLKLRHAFNNILLNENYFLQLILLGCFTKPESLAPYLRPSNFETMRSRIDRLENRMGTLAEIYQQEGPGSIDKFNLSNIFEWFDDVRFNQIFSDVLRLASPNARLCYRYTLAKPQKFDETNSIYLQIEEDLARELHKIDRAFMYESFHVYEVQPNVQEYRSALRA